MEHSGTVREMSAVWLGLAASKRPGASNTCVWHGYTVIIRNPDQVLCLGGKGASRRRAAVGGRLRDLSRASVSLASPSPLRVRDNAGACNAHIRSTICKCMYHDHAYMGAGRRWCRSPGVLIWIKTAVLNPD